MFPRQLIKRHSSGFSLIEIMVGLGIGLAATFVILQVFTLFEGQKRTSTSGADAQTNGGTALFTIERDARMAGYGFNLLAVLGCKVRSSYDGIEQQPPLSLVPTSLAPVTITQGLNGLPDSVNILYSSKENWSIPARITQPHPATATNFFLNTTLGIAVNDLLIAYEAGKDCTLLQVTGIPNGNTQIHHQSTSLWNPPGGQNIFPPAPPSPPNAKDGYGEGATLFNLGALVSHTYSLNAQSDLLLSDFISATNTSNVQALTPNIVNLQAQYGFDKRALPSDAQVTEWNDAMIDADGSGVVGDSGDIGRIYAVKLAVVARSALLEKPKSDGTCDTTTTTTVNKPIWSNGDIDVSKNPDGTANANWSCYRYKVFETIIPLRNLIWREK